MYEDKYVSDKKGIFEYVLGDCKDTKLLNIRIFDNKIAKQVYNIQTKNAEIKEESNCSLCAVSNNSNEIHKIYKFNEMEADHVTAWSKGGDTDINNCQMLCKNHNRVKGNK